MLLASIRLKNFRSHQYLKLDFAKKLNYIVGGNGQGKTTILESIYYLCTTKSFCTRIDAEAAKLNETGFEVYGSFENLTKQEAQINFFSEENKKVYTLNNKKATKNSDIIGRFPVVLLTPSDHSITQGLPSERRKFIDSVISQASETYLRLLIDYNKILKQRSYLLFLMKENHEKHQEELDAWNEKLIDNGSEIIKHRMKFINDFNNYVRGSYFKIMGSDEIPAMHYYTLDGYNGEQIPERFSELLVDRKKEELKRATNLIGPQRDDIVFEINGMNLKSFGSQGQHKTFQTALRFAEFFYLKEVTGTPPIFLLDDVFGELDAKRSFKISEYLGEIGQAFITLTDFGNFDFLNVTPEDKVIRLNQLETANA